MRQRISDEEINNVVGARNCEWVSGEYNNSHDKIEIKFPCGHIQFVNFYNFRKGHGCRICGQIQGNKTRTNPPQEIISEVESAGFTFLEFPNGYVGCHSKILYSCSLGHITERTGIDFSEHPTCKTCRMNKMSEDRRYSHDELDELLKNRECLLISDKDYKNRDSKINILFSCGHEESLSVQTFINRPDPVCRNCSKIYYTGINHWGWTGMTPTLHYLRDCIKDWYLESLRNTNFKCYLSGENAQTVHHIFSFNKIARLLFENLNWEFKNNVSEYTNEELVFIRDEFLKFHNSYGLGVPLTNKLHDFFHSRYSTKNFTPSDFEQFKSDYQAGLINI